MKNAGCTSARVLSVRRLERGLHAVGGVDHQADAPAGIAHRFGDERRIRIGEGEDGERQAQHAERPSARDAATTTRDGWKRSEEAPEPAGSAGPPCVHVPAGSRAARSTRRPGQSARVARCRGARTDGSRESRPLQAAAMSAAIARQARSGVHDAPAFLRAAIARWPRTTRRARFARSPAGLGAAIAALSASSSLAPSRSPSLSIGGFGQRRQPVAKHLELSAAWSALPSGSSAMARATSSRGHRTGDRDTRRANHSVSDRQPSVDNAIGGRSGAD